MLIQFSTENYLSFKQEASLNFEAGAIKEFPENVFEPLDFHDVTLLKSIALYGANSSGKSNLLKAFSFARNLIINSSKESQSYESLNVEPFRLSDEGETTASKFDVTFLLKGNRYRYGFSVNAKRIESEWLFVGNKRKQENIFIRSHQDFKLNKILHFGETKNKAVMLTEITRENALFLSVLAQFNIELGINICDWFSKSTIIFDSNNQEIINYTASLLSKPDFYSRINQIVSNSDLGFTSIDAKVKDIAQKYNRNEQFIAALFNEDIKSYQILTKHKKFKDGVYIGNIFFDLMQNESLGTQKYFGLLGPIIQTLLRGSVLLIDELDSRFHPLLLNIILKLFNSKMNNPNGAQLVFTLHNTDPLKKILRRDQMIFLEKDNYGASTFCSLYEKLPKTRNDASFEKDYLTGKYGAIPNIINTQLKLFGMSDD